jgi:hypothetical protein
MDWTEVARQNHLRAQTQLARRVNQSAISVPIGDSAASAPGWLNVGYYYSAVPDVEYPWDPAVVRAFREISDDVVPIMIRSVWRWSNYYELGKLGPALVLKRHGIARAVRNATTVHEFHCEMPGAPTPGLRIPGRPVDDSVPNYIEIVWHDRDRRDLSFDLPGAYLPFDWEFFQLHRRAAQDFERDKQRSRRARAANGDVVASGVARPKLDALKSDRTAVSAHRASEAAYERADIEAFYSAVPSDVELKEIALGGPKVPSPPVSVTVGADTSREPGPSAPAPSSEVLA